MHYSFQRALTIVRFKIFTFYKNVEPLSVSLFILDSNWKMPEITCSFSNKFVKISELKKISLKYKAFVMEVRVPARHLYLCIVYITMFVVARDPTVVHLLQVLLLLEGEDRPQPHRAGGGAGPGQSGQVRGD